MDLQRARNFVTRPPLIDLIAQNLHDLILSLPVLQCILNFYGVPGIGKTALLAAVEETYRHDQRLVTIGFSVEDLGQELQQAKVRFLKCFAAYRGQMADTLHTTLAELADTSDEEQLNAALQTLVTSLRNEPKPLLLVIDAWEYVPEALFAWVERSLLLPLMRNTRLLCLLGSQSPLRWRQFEVRRSVSAKRLAALSVAETTAQLGCGDAVGKMAYALTFGHPLANETLFHTAIAPNRHLPAAGLADLITSRRAELAEQVEQAIYARVLRLTEVTTELQQIFHVIALFREFDIHTLRTVLPLFYPAFRNRSESALLMSIKQLLDTRLVRWSDDSRAYQLDQTLRQILAHALSLREPDLYERIRAAAISYYEQLIHDVPGSRTVYVVEYFCHALYKAGSTPYNKKTIEDRMQKIVRAYYYSPDGRYRDETELTLLRKRFAQDEELPGILRDHQLSPHLFVQLIDAALEAPLSNGSDRWPSVALLK